MKKLCFFVLTILSCLLGLLAAACNQTLEFDYKIDFVADGKIIATVGTNGDKIAMPKNPEKEDYTFEGWYWDEGEWHKKFTVNSILDQPLQDKNHYKVYAKFNSSVYYTVIFNYFDKEISQQIKYGEPTALLLNTFECSWSDYAVFKWWRCSDDRTYRDGEVVLNLCNAGEKIYLSPVWEENYGICTIVFKPNGGVGNMPDQTIQRNIATELSANKFTREHFVFDRWNTEADGSGRSFSNEESLYMFAEKDETITLYAQWTYDDEYGGEEPTTYTIRYVEHDGTTLFESTMNMDAERIVNCLAYRAPDAHVLSGWNTKPDGTGITYVNGAKLDDVKAGQTIVLYAQYKKIESESVDGVYYVDDYSDLLLMKKDLNGTYVLTRDIILPGEMMAVVYECGTPSSPFNGKFFGNGHTISGGLYSHSYETETFSGLFGYIGSQGLVQDLHLDLDIDMMDYSATYARCNKGTIVNCSATGTLFGLENNFQPKDLYVGGVVIYNEGLIKNTLSSVFMGGTTQTKNIQMGGICVKNSGIVENCVFLRRNEYEVIGGYKYNDNTSFKIDGLMCVNEGTSANNYYFNEIKYEIKKGFYEGESVDEVYESGNVASQYGKSVGENRIYDKNFYTDTLKWSEEFWDFSKLNNNGGNNPVLKTQ